MGEIVNLRQARKEREKARRQAEAAENRVRHGRTGAQKKIDRLEAERRTRAQDGTRLPGEEPPRTSD